MQGRRDLIWVTVGMLWRVGRGGGCTFTPSFGTKVLPRMLYKFLRRTPLPRSQRLLTHNHSFEPTHQSHILLNSKLDPDSHAKHTVRPKIVCTFTERKLSFNALMM